MKRKILSLILVFAMTVSLLTVGTGAVEPTYGDTAGHWAESSIERWSGYGIIQGSNGQFDPNGQLTCAQLATILAKLLKLPAAKDAGFTDNTADAWYYDAINRCAAAGILNGNGDGTVTPEAPITRERAMVMLARALGIEPIRKPDLTKYTDAAQVSAYAQGYVAALIEAGIVGGVTADELAPQDNINRASTVTILDRAIGTYADKAGATVKADGKGIVLVVAENVKITGAPEGTKIVVADGATGLTVNGKSVSDDQTYIVPKTTTSSGSSSSGGHSHTHSYNETTHKCSCGAFAPAVVATIGNTNGYLTLKEAVAAATNGQTVKLVKDVELSKQFTIDKAITLDLGSHTLKSTWTMSGGQMYAIISNAPLTIQNGTVAVGQARAITAHNNLILDSVTLTQELTGGNACVAFSAAGKAYLITNSTIKGAYAVCNFANNATITISGSELIGTGNVLYHNGSNHGLNLTVTNTTITGTGDGYSVYLSGSTTTLGAGGLQKATFKNCTITGTSGVETKYTDLTMDDCTVTATGTPSFKQNNNGPATSGFAVVSTDNTMEPSAPAPDGKTTITGNKGSYTGLIGLRTFPGILTTYPGMKESTYAIAGGTFDHNPDAQYIAAGYEAKDNGNNTWTVSEKAGVTLVAQVGVNKYASLAAALAAAEDSDTVKLVGDTTLRSSVEINKSITLDLNGKTIHYTGADQKATNPRMSHRALNVTGGNVTIKNGLITTTVAGTDYPTEFDAVVVKSGADVTLKDMNITINDAKGSCLYVFEGGKATVKSGSYTNKNTSGEQLLLNQANVDTQLIFVEGGTFSGRSPAVGDENKGGTFLAPGYTVDNNNGVYTVRPMKWNEYPEDASVVPSGLVITEYPQNEFDSNNGKTGTITIKDKEALLYFAYKLNPTAAYTVCSAKHGSGWGHTCVWYDGSYARHIVLDADIDLGGMTLENGFGNMKNFAFDGRNHKICNVTINYTDTGNTGLFVGGNRGISNLVVENVNVIAPNGTENAVGIMSSDANADITNVTVRNSSVTGGKYTGAIVGYNYGSVTNCKVENCTVSGRYKVGGIIGYICNSNDVPTYVTGNVLTGVTVKGENLVAGKNNFVIGKIVGNWNATVGECSGNTFSGTTVATEDIGEIESRCIVTVNGVTQLPQNATAETINKVITESKDAEGNVVKDVKLALPSNSTFELNNGLAHEGDKSRNVTIVGDGTQTADVAKNATAAEGAKHLNYQRGSTFTFENVTVENGTDTYDGIVCDELIYRNCTIKGVTTLYGKATFIDCTFVNEMANQYSIWTWGGTDVKFEGCTFNTNGKAILLFGEEKTTNLTVTGCRFNDRNNGTAGKAAIEIGEANYGKHNNFTVVISDSEVVTGFAINSNGTNTGSKLWANKNSMDSEHLSVTIDGTKVL